MHVHGQLPAVFSVREREKLLEQLRVETDTRKLKLVSLSGMTANRATLRSPSDGRSSSSVAVSDARASRLNFSSLEASVTWMDLSVLAEPER